MFWKVLGRTAFILILLPSLLSADVVILKDGSRVTGRVVDKGTHYEVSQEGGLRTYLKEEVDRLVTSPKEFLGDTEKLYEEAKLAFTKAKTLEASSPERNEQIKDALAKLKGFREALTTTRELFPEDKYAELDQKLVLVMQLTRLLRGEVTHDVAGDFMTRTPVIRGSASPQDLKSAFATMLDPGKRSDRSMRASACEAFRVQRANFPELYEIATAAMLYLSRSDTDWKLQAPALKTLEEYFSKPWLQDPLKLTASTNQEAANYLSQKIAEIKKVDANATVEPLTIFGIGHLGHTPGGPETEKLARLFGLEIRNGIAGTPEGHVVRELSGWIAAGDFDLAVLSWVKEYRSIDTPVVRFVWSYALLRMAQLKKRGFERSVAALGTIQPPSARVRDHLMALIQSIKAVAICNVCLGEGKLRCTNCHGKSLTKIVCRDCKGTGRKMQSSGIPLLNCPRCKNTGTEQIIQCKKCKDGWNDCPQCDKKHHTPPELEDICTMTPCEHCDGRGFVFRSILWACPGCMGVGQKLAPKADPTKIISQN